MTTYPSDLVREVLSSQAERSIPATTDLWPEILRRHTDRPARSSAAAPQVTRRDTIRAAVALGLAALMVVVSAPWLSRQQTTAAAGFLSELAVVAAAQPAAPAVHAGSYAYTKSESMYLFGTGTYSALIPRTREIWIAPDGSGRIRESAGEPVFLRESDRAAWVAAGSLRVRGIDEDFGPGGLHFEDLSALPTDVAAMTTLVRERASRTQVPLDVEMFVVVGDLLRETWAAPEVRAALYRVAAGIPGVELIGSVQDRAGRQGVAVAKTRYHVGGTQRHTLIFDPTTTTLLGEESVLLTWPDAITGGPAVVTYVVYLESEVVEELPSR